ncbi:MAG: PCMD domain-containing protein [Bacteroides sp.]|nr:PCMD domain-containing protein [Bacteroides sp.]
MKNYSRLSVVALLALAPLYGIAQEKVVPIKYGDMDQWITRKIHESGIIGGNTKLVYEIGPTKEIDGNEPYKNMGGSPWGTSNVMAKVVGIVKTNNSVYKDARDHGYCARLETHIESVKVLGMVNITVLAAGSIYLGDMLEPITGTKNAEKNMNWGVPFTQRPKAVRYDYKVKMSGEKNRIRLTGFSKRGQVEGQDCAIAVFFLQKRTEAADGSITAKRVGTMVVKYDKGSDGWVNDATYEVLYGDITKHPSYNSETMGLRARDYARNSKGESVLIEETGWAAADENPTHMILQFSSSHGGAFIGSPGNTLWIDNVKLVY